MTINIWTERILVTKCVKVGVAIMECVWLLLSGIIFKVVLNENKCIFLQQILNLKMLLYNNDETIWYYFPLDC